jgi:amino acid transporter
MPSDEVTSIQNEPRTDKKDVKEPDPTGPTGSQDIDSEEKHSNGETHELPELQRRLKSRHLQMIAMGRTETPQFSILF